ncbi:MAG TPA: hypothetical protein VFN23_18130 [Ktedonobacteraceae bacterium]|nr:hypothetical protein [Ktedonobacteraceae bacterium]
MTRHVATALTCLLNALQAGSIGTLEPGALRATMQLASQARSVSEVNGYLVNCSGRRKGGDTKGEVR